jgi:hypothetical protein
MALSRGLVLSVANQVGGSMPSLTTINDESRYKQVGTLVNGTTHVQLPSGQWALSFDGVDDAVTIPFHSSRFKVPNQTIVAWVYQKEVKNQRIISSWNAPLKYDYLFTFPGAAPMNRVSWNRDGAGINSAISTSILAIKRWYLVCALAQKVGTNYNASVYVDGVLSGSSVIAITTALVSPGEQTVIGQAGSLVNTLVMNGYIAKLRMFNRLLNNAEIRSIKSSESRLFGV